MSIEVIMPCSKPCRINFSALSVGDTLIGRLGNVHSLYLRTYNKVIDLQSPRRSWGSNMGYDFDDARRVDIEVTVKGREDC